MTKDETKREIQTLYRNWPDRKDWKGAEHAAPAFYGWLQSSGQSVMNYGQFGTADKFQVIKGWCDEWEQCVPRGGGLT